ncbi:MAG TPA: N-acetyl-gamma-glutamyl-phosphate reductase [Firmicutes bacterium]|nr:N-acetyl-gamma-glutamyl-phosphate reductase [Bacillota bacterium]
MIKAGIIGASGYTGSELLRWLGQHPQVKVEFLSSRTLGGKKLADVHPQWAGWAPWSYEPQDLAAMARRCDVVFAAVPNGASMELARTFVEADCYYIDLSADFRLRDIKVYEQWYKQAHTAPDLNAKAAYGLPELFREEIKKAKLIGKPGCFPTGALLALAPLAAHKLIDMSQIIINAMTGVSGAGATPKPNFHFPHCTENVQAYATVGHRHTPEIEQGLQLLSGSGAVQVTFIPHLVPMSRGILTTVVCRPLADDWTTAALIDLFRQYYAGEPFVVVLGEDRLPQTKAVAGSNFCHVTVRYDRRVGRIIVQSALDNLVKGSSGQAVQSMNALFGLPETEGLMVPGLLP